MDRLNTLVRPLFIWTIVAFVIAVLSRGSHSSDVLNHLSRARYHAGKIEMQFSSPNDLETLRAANFELVGSPEPLSLLQVKSPGLLQLQVSPGFQKAFAETYVPGITLRSPPQLIFHAPNAALQDSSVFVEADGREVGGYQGQVFLDSPELKPYFGQLHAHTDHSDGRKRPSTAFDTAIAHGLDFFAVTDHLEYLDLDPVKWRQEKLEADQYNEPGHFVAFSGFEWSGYPEGLTIWLNHLNVINSSQIFSAFDTSHLSKIYKKISQLEDSSFGIFNHPGYKHYLQFKIDNWHNFAYSPLADLNLKLIRVEGEEQPHSFRKGYVAALDRGWHLGPEFDEDNHDGHFASSPERTGVWSKLLDRPTLVASFRAMATFYTADPQAALKLTADHRYLMGSTLKGTGSHHLLAEFSSKIQARVKQIDWFTYRGQLVFQDQSGRSTSELEVNPEYDSYYFVQVTEENGARLISAPIFIDR